MEMMIYPEWDDKTFAPYTTSYMGIMQTLYGSFINVYLIEPNDYSFINYQQSKTIEKMGLPRSGCDFFKMMKEDLLPHVYERDREYVCRMLKKETLLKRIENNGHYIIVFRFEMEGEQRYHRIRAVRKNDSVKELILLDICDIDRQMEREKTTRIELEQDLTNMKKQLSTILSGAVGCLKVNLNEGKVCDVFLDLKGVELSQQAIQFSHGARMSESYENLITYLTEEVAFSGKRLLRELSTVDYLISKYRQNIKRLSINFEAKLLTEKGFDIREIEETIYLSQDDRTGDIIALFVFHEMTERNTADLNCRVYTR